MTKINKPLISGIESKTYSKGRWDLIKIELVEDLIEPLQELFKEIGFSKEVILDLDMYYPSLGGFHTFYSEKAKIYFYTEEKILDLIFDTAIPKKELMKTIGKYFQLFK